MQRCPYCNEALDGPVPICWHCGRAVDTGTAPSGRPAPVADATFDPSHEQNLFDQSWFDDGPMVPAPATTIQDADLETWSTMGDANDVPAVEPEQMSALPQPPIDPFAQPTVAAAADEPPAAAPASAQTVPEKAPARPRWQLPAIDFAGLRSARPGWQLPAIGLAGLGTVVVVLSVMGRPASDAGTVTSPTAAPPAANARPAASAPPAAPAPPAAVAEPNAARPAAAAPFAPPPASAPFAPAVAPSAGVIDEAPAWIVPRRANFGPDGLRTLTLQLAALSEVRAGREQVRPMLAVRCLSRRTHVFVSLGTSASIEGGDTHTVTVQFDDEAPITQQWPGSASYQELFAPDGVHVARRLAQTRTMRLTFTPFRSRPVTAEFHVQGFDRHVKDLARMCGWPVETKAARSRLP